MTQEQFNALVAMIEAIIEDKTNNDNHSAVKLIFAMRDAKEALVVWEGK